MTVAQSTRSPQFARLALRAATVLVLALVAIIYAFAARQSLSQERVEPASDSSSASAQERANPLRRAKNTNRAVSQAAYNQPDDAPMYQRSPIDYFEAGSPARQYPPAKQYPPDAQYPPATQYPPSAHYPSEMSGNTYRPASSGPSVFQRAAATGMVDSQGPYNMPSPASAFPEQSNGQACDENGTNYSGAPNPHGAFHAVPGNGVPEAYQTPHYPRAIGFGEPLMGTSWQNRPFHVDIFSGTMIGDDAIDSQVGQEAGFFIGARLGWDYDYYWGVESRLGLSWMSLFDRQNAQIVVGSVNSNNNIGSGNIIVWDMSILYYPWGDSRWRPFLLLGTGIQQLDSYNDGPSAYSGTLFELPFGLGMKYRMNEWLVFRFDVIDNLAFGAGSLDTMHNVSFTAGLEYHFGGKRRNYWPWNPNPKH